MVKKANYIAAINGQKGIIEKRKEQKKYMGKILVGVHRKIVTQRKKVSKPGLSVMYHLSSQDLWLFVPIQILPSCFGNCLIGKLVSLWYCHMIRHVQFAHRVREIV